jgi:hypothetical protein
MRGYEVKLNSYNTIVKEIIFELKKSRSNRVVIIYRASKSVPLVMTSPGFIDKKYINLFVSEANEIIRKSTHTS